MGIQTIFNGGSIWQGGEKARGGQGHVMMMPGGGNHYRYSGYTGTIGAALAANSEVFQFRFVTGTKTRALVTHVEFEGIGIVAAATVAGVLGFQMVPARAWTVAGSGGTRIAVSGDNLQLETAIGNSQVNDMGIATTGALTAGTKTLDANAVGGVLGSVGTAALTAAVQTSPIAPGMFFEAYQNQEMPLVLENQEGFVIRTTHVGPASLTYVARFGVSWREVTEY